MNIKKISMLLIFVIFSYYTTIFAQMQPPEIRSESAVLMSFINGQILYGHNAEVKQSPAGLVKIISCLVSAEKNNINSMVEIKHTYEEQGEVNIGLKEGEQIELKWLIHASLVGNASDATLALAEYTSGSIEAFVNELNLRIGQLGCVNTKITNPTGSYDENQYTTVTDMALITKAAMENPHILSILKTARITIPETNLSPSRFYRTNNHLISAFIENQYIYPNALGGKTGYTGEDGYALSAFAAKGEQWLIAIIMGGLRTDGIVTTFTDSTKLFDYGFSAYKLRTVANVGDILYEHKLTNAKNTDFVTLVAESSLKASVERDDDDPQFDKQFFVPEGIVAPIEKGQGIGYVEFKYKGNKVGRINLVASAEAQPNIILNIQMFLGYIWGFALIRYIIYGCIFIVVLYLVTVPPLVKHLERKAMNKHKKGRKY